MPTPRSLPVLPRRLALTAALTFTALIALVALSSASARASTRQIAIIQDQNLLQENPSGTMAQMQALGATTVRVFLDWDALAPDAESTHRPRFDATSPSAYPAGKWAFFDEIDRLAKQDGMTIDLVLTGGAPRWAEGSGIPSAWVASRRNPVAAYWAWKPNASEFGQFAQAVGERYDGHYKPSGATSVLPSIHFWTLWNEPNFGQDLGPQAVDTSRYSYAPGMYRSLVRSSYSALSRTGHAHNTILIGEFAAHGDSLSDGHHGPTFPQGLPGNGAQTEPVLFAQTLYCVDASDHALTGAAASNAGCPTNAAGRRSFRKDNPGLFDVTGVGNHPYANNGSPTSDGRSNDEWSTLPNLGHLEAALDGANRAWGSSRRYPIYNDEYGYITDPPQHGSTDAVSPNTAALYINEAEYLSWRQPRVASYDQYLIQDGSPAQSNPNGGFASGLYFSSGKPKPSLNAYRLPLWVPSTTLHGAGRTTVWGEARPALWARRATRRTQSVAVQFRAHDHGSWKTIATEHSDGYFQTRPRFTSSGQVRLSYTYPSATTDPMLDIAFAGKTIVSRTQQITVR